MQHGALLGPLDHVPFDIHISPFMIRPKYGSDVRRTVALSWPECCSVNDRVSNNIYLGTELGLQYPSVDSIVRTLNQLGPGTSISKGISAVPFITCLLQELGLQVSSKELDVTASTSLR